MDLWRALRVSWPKFRLNKVELTFCGRELAEPQKLIPLLLKTGVTELSPGTIGVHLQAVLKIFGLWTSELSQNWDDDDLPRVKAVVSEAYEALQPFASSPDMELQERVCPPPPALVYVVFMY